MPSPTLAPPTRLLAGPGPSNVDPRVAAAIAGGSGIGHLDPWFHEVLHDLGRLLHAAWRQPDGFALALSSTGSSGMEAGMAALLEPGDTAVIANAGFFGGRLVEMARRTGATIVELTAPYGQVVPVDEVVDALDRHPGARLAAVVHAETSTGAGYPLAELGAAMRGRDALLLADCVTSLGGQEVDLGGWGVDYAYSCTQKCLGAPPGLSPVALSERALERVASRRSPVPFWFDFAALRRYWVDRPAGYHHTVPVASYLGLHEALRIVLDEGLEARAARHADAAAHLQARLRERGLELLADPSCQLAQLSAVLVPDGVDGKAVQRRLLDEHGIEVGGALGPGSPAIWRLGLMGVNATRDVADRLLAALDHVLDRAPALA